MRDLNFVVDAIKKDGAGQIIYQSVDLKVSSHAKNADRYHRLERICVLDVIVNYKERSTVKAYVNMVENMTRNINLEPIQKLLREEKQMVVVYVA